MGRDSVEPIITPAGFLGRDALPPELMGCTVAVVGFCRFREMARKLSAEPLPERIFSHLGHEHQLAARVNGHVVLALECLYGGPMSATVLEELAHYGIRRVVGYGYAGSLVRDVPVGRIVLADAAPVSGGTAHEYLPGVESVAPDPEMARLFRAAAAECGVVVQGATVWTTDAIYRETLEKVARWRDAGAQVVNMDTAHFYAVSQVTGLSAVYACVTSDCVEGPAWEDGFARVGQAVDDLEGVVVALLTSLVMKEAGR